MKDKKPCIQCGELCDIFPVMLGDTFTLTYLRVCGPECLFLEAYDYLYKICYHKDFRNHLSDKQYEDDAKLCDEFIKTTTDQYLESFEKHLKANPEMLTYPAPDSILSLFKDSNKIPNTSAGTMCFKRYNPTKQEKMRMQKEHIEKLQKDLREAQDDLDKLMNDRLGEKI